MDGKQQQAVPRVLSFSEVRQSERTKHVHGLHPYLGKFIPQLVEFLLKHSRLSRKDIVVDPFAGSGTTNVECMVRGIPSIGLELSEFGHLFAKAKTGHYNLKILKREIRDFEEKARQVDYSAEIKPGEYLRTWYSERSQKELLHMVNVLETADYKYRDFLRVIVSRIARSARLVPHYSLDSARLPVTEPYYCYSHKRTCFPTESALKFLHRYCTDSFRKVSERPDMQARRERKNSGCSRKIICADARHFRPEADKIRGLITSPPYLGLMNYHEQHKYAYELFGLKWKPEQEIGSKAKGQGKKARERYERDMVKVFGNLHSTISDSATISVVVADRFNLYPEIFHLSGFKILRVSERRPIHRTALRCGGFTEKVFVLRKG